MVDKMTLRSIIHHFDVKKLKELVLLQKKFSLDELQEALVRVSIDEYAGAIPILLQLGADVNKEPQTGDYIQQTPLYHASREGHAHAVEVLIEHGADVNRPVAKTQTTPLCAAIDFEGDIASYGSGPPVMVTSKILFEAGANPFCKDAQGETPMDLAVFYKHVQAVEAFSKYHR